jgi:hypothetical protein
MGAVNLRRTLMTDKADTALISVALVRAALRGDEAETDALLPPDADTRAIAISVALLAAAFAGLLNEHVTPIDELLTYITAELINQDGDEQ